MPDIIVLIRQHLYNGLIDWQYCNRGGYMNNREAQFIAKQTMKLTVRFGYENEKARKKAEKYRFQP